MDLKYNTKQLTIVEYPGTVVNVNNMTKTLGGEKEMFKVFKNPTKRLELKFRPDDPYCKCAHGDRFNSTNLLIKVVKRTKKKKYKNGEIVPEPEVQLSVELLGVACTSYKFKAMADFQMLPISFDSKEGRYKSLLPMLVPTSLHSSKWLDGDVELFVPPILFSRFDLPQSGYVETHTKGKTAELQKNLPPNIIGRGRKRRAGFAVFMTFESTDPFDTPQQEAIAQLKTIPLDIEAKKKLDVLFQEQPIWSKNALILKLKCEKMRLKYPLPCSAYYYTNGPWRALWVRFGYDPRKDPAAKKYQVMDLRINPSIPINEKRMKTRPSYYTLPNKSNPNKERVATINTMDLMPPVKEEVANENEALEVQLLACKYFPGQLPTARQCFYQLCDIHLDSVQKLVHKNDGQEDFCHEKDGWCLPGTLEKCRELLIADIQKTVKELKEVDGSAL
ncbi:hypothetical protein JTE90_027300 [Oedothorax gibbosus]|uniref:General transcription factor 3C polypeptide 5 n=1 Tax=Oedothorax gibbosus TaxID=931172 RepID=A0AAV6VZD3_9ARAC|nr:hypothetical protein JTE90_027300 [Oedothorax gibbosus]